MHGGTGGGIGGSFSAAKDPWEVREGTNPPPLLMDRPLREDFFCGFPKAVKRLPLVTR